MNKLSQEQISEVLGAAPGVIRGLVERNQFLEEKLASKERRERVEKVASEMQRKGIDERPVDTIADDLEKRAAEGKSIEVMEDAVELVGPDMGSKIGHVANDEQRGFSGSSDFERFIVGGVG